jgi:hypothetical protein
VRGAWTRAEQSAIDELQGCFTEIIEFDKRPTTRDSDPGKIATT